MAQTGSILLLGDDEHALAERSGRVRALGFPTARAKTVHDALLLAEEGGRRFRAALIDAALPAYDIEGALRELRRRAAAGVLEAIATGTRPAADVVAQLRAAGVERALWEPIGDHRLRFELNRAFADPGPRRQRGELRAATELGARIFVAGRAKTGSLYTLSATGTFVETARPSMRGARVAIELPLASGEISLAGTVVYANVPGNLQRPNLPTGMAVRFEQTTPEQLQRLREAVAGCAAQAVL